ncbi:MAG: cob(I)yrinic acid a,c-diamide adenosyltransferase [Spirochaetales bacterium]|nr:cob(I)yrinic acid a,c-diamide adenosyltransferase [Spirochaetales bacterium]
MRKGFFIIYTGNGKGKTTAALGLAFRAMGHGLKVCMIQFVKSGKNCGEHKMGNFPGSLFTCHVTGKGFLIDDEDIKKNRETAVTAWACAKKVINSKKYDLIILDELTYLLSFKLLNEQEVLDFIIQRPGETHIIITGRNAPASFVDKADIVTEMREIKHHFKNGVKACKGIEW